MNKAVSSAQTKLLVAGAKAYPQALTAISEFCRQVQSVFRESVERELSSINQAMKVKMKLTEVKNYADPETFKKPVKGDWAALGVKIDRTKQEGYLQLYYIQWYEGKAYLTTQVTFKDKLIAKRVFDRLLATKGSLPPPRGPSNRQVWFEEVIDVQGATQLNAAIVKALRRWAARWNRVGGLHKAML